MSTALQAEDLAFEALYRLNRPVVYAYALSTLRHPSDAEDVTQTTFLNAYTALHRGVAPRDDLQWLLAITRNVCRDRFRDANRRPKEEKLADWTPAPPPSDPDFTVAEICKQISELSPRHRKILLMREFEGRSYDEISAELGVSQAAVHTLLARARRTLRDELELGMTCAHARRVSLRHLNGVALRDERRALQRHLRKCADCATFVGRTPRTPLAQMLWICTMPYRKLLAILAGTSAPTAPAAGGAALAAKVLAVTAIGSTAVGVTMTEIDPVPSFSHGKPAPAHRSGGVPPAHRTTGLAGHPVASIAWSPSAVTVGRTGLTHASHDPAAPAVAVGSTAITSPLVTPVSDGHQTPAAPTTDTPSPSTPAAPPAPVSSPATAPAAEASAGAESAPASGTVAQAPASIPADPTPTGIPATQPAPVAADPAATASPSTPDQTVAPTPLPDTNPNTTPAPAPQGSGRGNSNAVGQASTPPGQAQKADQTAHLHP